MENKFISSDDLMSKMRSKKDLYYIYKYQLGIFLPSYRRCPVNFLKQIMRREKSTLYKCQLQLVDVPNFDELSINVLWDKMKTKEKFTRYMPDYLDNDLPEHEFFFGVLSTQYTDQVVDMVNTAYWMRNKEHELPEDELIEITEEFFEKFNNVVAFKTTPGRVLLLSKLKSKNESKNKQRKKYQVDLDPFDQPPTASIWREQHAENDEEEKKEN